MLLLYIGYLPVLANIMTTIDKGLVISVLSTSIRLQPKKNTDDNIHISKDLIRIFGHCSVTNNTYIFKN